MSDFVAHFKSFAGGEITPELAGRMDLVKNQTGLAEATNFVTLPHGPAARRPGTEFCTFAADSDYPVRLITFEFSATQTAAVEFGHEYIRIVSDGALVLDSTLNITGISQANPGVLSYTGTDPANGDWFYLQSVGGMTEVNGRFFKVASVNAGANTFQLNDVHGNAFDTTGLTAYTSGGEARHVLTLATTYDGGQVFSLEFSQDGDIITITHPEHPARELARVSSTSWTLTDVTFAPGISAPGAPSVVATVPTATNLSPHTYCVTSVMADGVTESLASGSTSVNNNLSISGNYNTITWSSVVGASRYRVYKKKGGGWGFIGQTNTLSAVDDNIGPDTTQSPPEDIIALNSGADDYPAAVAHFEQRRWFGGMNAKPQVMIATRTGTSSNLTSSIPSRDDDAMELRVAAMQNNRIVHLVPLSDLIAFTSGGEFRVFSDGAPAITPTTVSIKPQGFSGADSYVQPVVTSNSAMYVQAQGAHVRELSYNWETNLYRSSDLSIMAPHRFEGTSLVQMAYSHAPDPVLWVVTGAGVLLGMTHVPEQQVYAWHAHTTDGFFESVCVVPEAGNDVLYVVVRRTLNGVERRTIERFKPRYFVTLADSFFVDCGLTYLGAEATTIGNLWHLEGETVSILADGAVVPDQVVTNGTITLEQAAAQVQVGLRYTSRLKTLPLTVESAPAFGQGQVKNATEVHLRIRQSSTLKVGPSFDKLTTRPVRLVTDDMGSPPPLRDGVVSVKVSGAWDQDAAICVQQDDPLPLTVLSMAVGAALGG